MGNIKANIVAAAVGHAALWFAMFTVFAGLMFFAWGVYALLAATAIGSGFAAMIVGGGLIGLIAIVALVVTMMQAASKPPSKDAAPKRPTSDKMIEHQIRPVLGNRATDWAKANTGLVLVGALSAGILLSASPRLRSLIIGASGPIVTRKLLEAAERFTQY